MILTVFQSNLREVISFVLKGYIDCLLQAKDITSNRTRKEKYPLEKGPADKVPNHLSVAEGKWQQKGLHVWQRSRLCFLTDFPLLTTQKQLKILNKKVSVNCHTSKE